ncbi:MAG: aminotransferase class V-fold PLP-dependent enzyme [Oscillibacter sp.]
MLAGARQARGYGEHPRHHGHGCGARRRLQRTSTRTHKRVSALRDRLIDGLSKIPHSALNGDPVNRLPGNVSFCFEGVEGESLLLLLDAKGICASSGSACTSGSLDPKAMCCWAIGRPHEAWRTARCA